MADAPVEPPAAAPSTAAKAVELPRKRIHSQADLDTFCGSRLCQQLISFASELGQAVQGLEISPERIDSATPIVRGLVGLLSELESWIDDFPPLEQPMRFGNRAFRQWHARLVERGEGLLLDAMRNAAAKDADELAGELALYLSGAFGDQTRIDYGTGHEASFFALLFILGARGILAKTDAADAVLLVFTAYVRVMHRLQTVYVLEPAGSHGVWGLDDFHALPFFFGAAQLVGREDEVPTGTVYHESITRDYADRFLYVGAIRQVLACKRGAPFHETSPMLYDITAVPTWLKIQNGLLKMYRAEVLGKFPVIQHFLFGPTIRWPGDEPGSGAQAQQGASTGTPPPPQPPGCPVSGAASAPGAPCVAPWAKTPAAGLPDGAMCVAPWAKAPGVATGFAPTVAPWANKS